MSTDTSSTSDPYTIREEERAVPAEKSASRVLFGEIRDLFLPLYRAIFTEDSPTIRGLKDRLQKADINMTVEDYVASWMAAGTFLGVLLTVLGAVTGAIIVGNSLITVGLFEDNSLLAMASGISFAGFVGGIIGLGVASASAIYYPEFRARRRAREIDRDLTDAIMFMYSLSAGGIGTPSIIREVARSEDTYGELSREFQNLVLEMETFKENQRDALQKIADQSPSTDLRDFLYELATNISSGGDITQFLSQKREVYLRHYKRAREQDFERMEFFNEIYIALTILPVGAIVVLVGIGFQIPSAVELTPLVVYGLMPIIGVAFLVMASSATEDRARTKTIESESTRGESGFFSAPVIEQQLESAEAAKGDLERMRRAVIRSRIKEDFFGLLQEYPQYSLLVSVPVAIVVEAVFLATGMVDLSLSGFTTAPGWTTTLSVVVPLLIVLLPLGYYYERKAIRRRRVKDTLTSTLQKLQQANEADLPLLKAIETTGDKSDSILANELKNIPFQVRYGSDLESELIALANKFKEPRLVRTTRLINRAREASSNISDVLETAAELSSIEDDMREKRRTKTQTQTAIVVMAFLTLTFVILVLKVTFLSQITKVAESATATDQSMFSAFDTEFVNMIFLHAILVQAVISGTIAGYMRSGRLRMGIKYIIALVLTGLAFWGLTTMVA